MQNKAPHARMFLLRWKQMLPLLAWLMLPTVSAVHADEYTFDKTRSSIHGRIKYSVIGTYQARFDNFSGQVDYDPRTRMLRKVYLEIDAKSFHSVYERLDKIVRSPRILDTAKYPKISFQGTKVEKEGELWKVTGILDLHGVKKNESFYFFMEAPEDSRGQIILKARGRWVINRKDYGITWNKILDKGGIVVGNHITIQWEMIAL